MRNATNKCSKAIGYVLSGLLLSTLLSGCGKKSDLTLPDKQPTLAGFADQHNNQRPVTLDNF
ncbi:hypothetical protein THMIRHAS_21520 [Thiosulfatimonas sediminis]|uniref:Lipoprotein n=1 Tax=Thiosulfatimonas sediminis TaxID=2675054 RepID=A0A6F8PXD3_9GAMM|nr:lipoprotein [Thiosulfatimonas sediminis]BBP46779.1 hypothetical protein THMIRHAS_21520 [Thiosulfatimonas sediminis]